ncbi:MFS transporter [Alteromonas pelagimontana]|uniref:MFS transporter n=1 Tax=Alteromonas pelagimontana TaxID=1858656 RepID=A0A6M4MBG5_9ALTE|nr:MFS transporter [Alteromonas pelagimontana]QJR80148.1 MFS transporter [Alteromonas pelagimontana]
MTAQAQPVLSSTLVTLFSICCGAIVANIYYAQPIIELIAPDVGISTANAGFIVSLTQIGYALGLFFLVPLADLLENRRLMLATLAVTITSLVGMALTDSPAGLLLMSTLIGFSSVSVQILIPLAAHLAREENRGRVVGNIMSGLLLGILLARPVSSLIADHFGWRAVFYCAAVLMLIIAVVVIFTIPSHQPQHKVSYRQLVASLAHLFKRYALLRQRAFYQGLMFAAFSLYWTAAPLFLSERYNLSQTEIAIFALVGAIGAIAAPMAGRLADAGLTEKMSKLAMILAAVSFVPGLFNLPFGLMFLALTGVLLDFAVQMNMVLGQREIYALDPHSRGRLNALYMTSIFIGGAAGSTMAGALYAYGGWFAVAIMGSALPLLALLVFLKKSASRPLHASEDAT